MKTLACVHNFGVPARRFIRNGIVDLRAAGHDVRVITDHDRREHDHTPTDSREAAIPVVVYPWRDTPSSRPRLLRHPIRWLSERLTTNRTGPNTSTLTRRTNYYLHGGQQRFTEGLRSYISEFKPDVVHVHFGFTLPAILRGLRGLEIPILVTWRGVDASAFLRRPAYVKAVAAALRDRRVYSSAVSQSLHDSLSSYGIMSNRRSLLPTSIDLDYYQPKALPNGAGSTTKFLQISSDTPKKGIVTTLRAFSKYHSAYPNQDWHLTVAGGEVERIRPKVVELGLSDRVTLVGKVTPAAARELLHSADCFVHHSITPPDGDMEGIPNAILEAMAMELPVLVSDHSGIPEVVTNGVNGRVVPQADMAAYLEAIHSLHQPGRYPQNREIIKARFSREVHAATLANIYAHVRDDYARRGKGAAD